MPFNPGVQDISGQLLGQGISQFGAGLARGIEQWDQNEQKRRTAAGTIASYLKATPEAAQAIDPKLIDKFIAGKTSLLDTQQILGGITTWDQQRKEEEQRRTREINDQLVGANAELAKQHALALQQDQRANQELNARADQIIAQSQSNGVLSPQMQAEIDRLVQSPAVQLRMQGAELTPKIMADIATTEIAHRPRPVVPPGGFGTAQEAQSMIPKGVKGQVSQTRDGRYILQYQTEPPAEKEAATTALAKLVRERDDFRQLGRADIVADYDRVISEYGKKPMDLLTAAMTGAGIMNLGAAIPPPPAAGTMPNSPVPKPATPGAQPAPIKGTRARQNGKLYEYDGATWQEVKGVK